MPNTILVFSDKFYFVNYICWLNSSYFFAVGTPIQLIRSKVLKNYPIKVQKNPTNDLGAFVFRSTFLYQSLKNLEFC